MSYGGEDFEYEWPDDNGQEGWGNDAVADDQEGNDNIWIQIENAFYEAEGNIKDSP